MIYPKVIKQFVVSQSSNTPSTHIIVTYILQENYDPINAEYLNYAYYEHYFPKSTIVIQNIIDGETNAGLITEVTSGNVQLSFKANEYYSNDLEGWFDPQILSQEIYANL